MEQFYELMDEAYHLPYGKARIDLLEQAINRADTLQDIQHGYRARKALVDTCFNCSYPKRQLNAFIWMVSMTDKHPELFDENDLLWEYKWIIDRLGAFPEISRKQTEGLLLDFKIRYERCGYSMRTYYDLQKTIALDFGDLLMAEDAYTNFVKTKRDGMSNCKACEQDDEIRYLAYMGKYEEMMQKAQPILKGSMTCAQVPHFTYERILTPLYKMGRLEEADKYFKKAWKLCSGKSQFIKVLAELLAYAVLRNMPNAISLIEKEYALVEQSEDTKAKFKFYQASALLYVQIERLGVNIKPVLSQNSTVIQSGIEAGTWFMEETKKLAKLFDERNGNSFYDDRLQERLLMVEQSELLEV